MAAKDFATTRTQDEGRVVGMITVAVVTHEHVEVRDGGHHSVGQIIDDHLADCAHRGVVVQEVRFEVGEREWPDMARRLVDTTRRID